MSCSNCKVPCEKLVGQPGSENYPRTNEEFIYDPLKMSHPAYAVINLTNQCNFRCTYCFVDFNPKVMEYETAKAACEFVIKNAKLKNISDKPGITLFGGEPLLCKDLIYRLVREYFDQIEFSITTNGSLLEEDFVLFCYKHGVSIMLSMDGDRETQNDQRVMPGGDSFDTVVWNIHYYIAMYERSIMRATLTKRGLPRLFQNYKFAKDQGFTATTFVIDDLNDSYSKDDLRIYEEQVNLIAMDCVRDLFEGRTPMEVIFLKDAYQRFGDSREAPIVHNTLMRCGFGTTSCGIAPNGDIIPCQEKSSYIESEVIGNVFEGINEEKHQRVLENYFERYSHIQCPEGYKCPPMLQAFCKNNTCPSRLENPQTDFVISEAKCLEKAILFKAAGRLYSLLHGTKYDPIIEQKEENADGTACDFNA